jgi:hypothetical protein
MTAAIVGERPPSPPISNDGDFGFTAVPDDTAGLEKHAPPREVRSAPTGIGDPGIVSTSQVAAPVDVTRRTSDSFQDLYGNPSLYHTAQNYTYYTAQPVRDLVIVEIEGHTNLISVDV